MRIPSQAGAMGALSGAGEIPPVDLWGRPPHGGVMEYVFETYGLWAMIGALASMAFGGFAKGVVGFALPMVAVSGVGSFMAAEMAVAAIIFPGVITNLWQAFRTGPGPVRLALVQHWRIFVVMLPVLGAVALSFTRFSDGILFTAMGVIVLVFAFCELARVSGALKVKKVWEFAIGLASGLTGGLGGLWGPPIMIYLMLTGVPKTEFVRIMGVVFLLGAIVLLGAHLASGVLRAETYGFSAVMILPALLGMWLGMAVQDRLDQALFKKAVLIVLVLAGVNLLRRGLLG